MFERNILAPVVGSVTVERTRAVGNTKQLAGGLSAYATK